MGLFSKDLYDAKTGEKAGSASRLSSSYKTHTQNLLMDRKLVDGKGNHVVTQPSILKESAGAIIGITAGIVSIFGSIFDSDD